MLIGRIDNAFVPSVRYPATDLSKHFQQDRGEHCGEDHGGHHGGDSSGHLSRRCISESEQ